MKKIIAILALCAPVWANAATYYFSDCQTGADAACVAGSNVNAGSSAAPWQTPTGKTFTGGDTWLFARGGSWLDVNLNLPTNPNSGATTTLTDYTPSWCTVGCVSVLPRIKAGYGATTDSMFFRIHYKRVGHYVVSNIHGIGYDGTRGKFVHVQGSSNIIVDGIYAESFSIGIGLSEIDANGAAALTGYVSDVVVKNSTIVNSYAQGLLGGGDRILIENNIFDTNGRDNAARDHNIYISSAGYFVDENITVRGNTLRNSGRVLGSHCKSVSLVVHGNMPNLLIEGNLIEEAMADGTCYGIAVNGVTGDVEPQIYDNLIIRDNIVYLTNDGTATSGVNGITIDSAPNAIIENNTIIRDGTGGFSGINIPSGAPSMPRGDGVDSNQTIRNNSIWINSTSAGAVGIESDLAGSASEIIASNLIVFGPASSASAKCFQLRAAAAGLETMDNNICYRAAGANTWSNVHSTLAAAQAAGFDTSSSAANPTLAATPASGNSYSMAVQSGSIAINAGHATKSARLARDRYVPVSTRDIGSHEYGATVHAPQSPTGGLVQ